MDENEVEYDSSDGNDSDFDILAYLWLEGEPTHGGSERGKAGNRDLGHDGASSRFIRDYMCESPVFTEEEFRRRYRVSKSIFIAVVAKVQSFDSWFIQTKNCAGKMGISAHLNVAVALVVLGNGSSFDRCVSEYRMSSSTISSCLHRFCTAMVSIFFDKIVRYPTDAEAQAECNVNADRGFPGCIGSIDCQNWRWGLCPVSHHGHYTGKDKKPTVKLEAVCTHDLYVWHAFFGQPGSCNDLITLNHSPFVKDVVHKKFQPAIQYWMNGSVDRRWYLLADGIYPKWSIFAKTIACPVTESESRYATRQESCRKDVERLFGVLHKRFAILRHPSAFWSKEKLAQVMKACLSFIIYAF